MLVSAALGYGEQDSEDGLLALIPEVQQGSLVPLASEIKSTVQGSGINHMKELQLVGLQL